MSDIDDVVRETLASRAHDAPTDHDLLAATHAGVRRRHRRRVTAAATGLACIGAAAVAVIAVRTGGHGQTVLGPPTVRGGPAVPAGMQPISFHGLQLFVPAGWHEHDTTTCGTPKADTFLLSGGGGTPACLDLRPQPAGITVVRILAADEQEGRQLAQVATVDTTVDGHAARTGYGVPPGERAPVTVLVVPDPGVVVSVEAPSRASARAVLSTAQVTPVDSNGCADHVASLAAPPPSGRAGAATELVPGAPTTAAVCRYTGDWLARSVPMSPDSIPRLQSTLNGGPGDASTAPSGQESSDMCREDEQRGFVIRFGYADAAHGVDVVVHIGGCQLLSATNGSRMTGIDEPIVTTLLDAAGYDGAFPDPTTLGG